MLGCIRFVLAFFVLISHLPSDMFKLNLGVVGVICFYFISGFLMKKSYARFVEHSTTPVRDFYLDRVIKLFPQYILVVLLSFGCIWYFGESTFLPKLNQEITVERVLLNLALLPTNYVFPPLEIESILPYPIIIPAWSLATEFHFYLMLPFLFLLKRRYLVIVLFLSMALQFSSFFYTLPYFNMDNFGYRYIPSVLNVFLFGYFFADRKDPVNKWICNVVWVMYAFFLMVVTPSYAVWRHVPVQEVLFGGFIALPMAYYFTTVTVDKTLLNLDRWIGDLAYPIFISHWLCFYLVEKVLNIPADTSRVKFYVFSMALTVFVSIFLALMQKKIEAFRIRLRGFESLRDKKSEDVEL